MKPKHFVFSLIIALFSPALPAQNDCGELTMSEARKSYELGDFDKVTDLLSPCLENGFKSDAEYFAAYKLLANTYIATSYFKKAEEIISKMLIYRPDYTPNNIDENWQFVKMVISAKISKAEENQLDVLVTTATKKAQRSSDAPATIHVLTQEQIVNRGYSNLLDLLEDIPEVEIQRNSVSEFKNVVSLRGISGNEKFVIMLDGVRITPTTGDPYVMGTNFSLANAKRVEVIIGPASALYGVDGFSGIINIITQDFDDIQNGIVNVSYGQYNTTDNYFVTGMKNKHISLMLTGQFYATDEPDYNNIYKDEYEWYNDIYKSDGTVGHPFSDSTYSTDYERDFAMPTRSYFINAKLNFGNFEIGTSRHYERHSTSIGVDPQFTIYSKDAFFASAVQTFYAKHIYVAKDTNAWSLQTLILRSDFQTDPESKYINAFTDYLEGYKYQFGKSTKIEEQFDCDLSKRASLIVGASIEDLSALPKTGDLPVPFDKYKAADSQSLYYLGTNTVDENGNSLTVFQNFYYLNFQNIGSFAQLLYKHRDFIEVTLGSRYDYNTRYGGSFNPRAGLLIKPSKKMKVKFLYGQSFLAPSPWKAYQHFGSFSADTDTSNTSGLSSSFLHLPNPDLQPERLSSFEGGLSYFVRDNIFLAFNGYYNKIESLINLDGSSDIDEFRSIPVSTTQVSDNNGAARMYGGTVRTNLFYKLGDQKLNVYAAYSYADGKIDSLALTLTAKHTIKAGVGFNDKKFSVFLRGLYRTKSNSVIADTEDPDGEDYLTNDAFTVLNLFVKYNLVEKEKLKLSVYARIHNLLNSKYYNVAYTTDVLDKTPQDPIRINGGIRVIF